MSASNSPTGSHTVPGSPVRPYPPVIHLGDPVLAETMHTEPETPGPATSPGAEPASPGPTARLLRLITLVQDDDATMPPDDTKAQVLDELEAIIEVQQETLARLECLYQTIREL